MASDQSQDQVRGVAPVEGWEALRPYLEGYCRGDPAVLRALYRRDWRSAALAELHRRHDRLLSVLDDALLERMACGQVDVVAAASQVAAELDERVGRASTA